MSIDCAGLYFKLTGRRHVYSIMPIDNIPSIMSNGILSHEKAKRIPHLSVADPEVQDRREKVTLPTGVRLHQYANLYFSFWNPMLSRIRSKNEEICILGIAATVLNINGCAVTDRNAATALARFYTPQDGLSELDYKRIHAKNWTIGNAHQVSDNRAVKCAEVLIPGRVPPEYVMGAYVVSEHAKEELLSRGFEKQILMKPDYFFK